VTPRKKEIAHLIIQGFTNPQIAARLHLKTDTVRIWVSQMMRARGLRNRTELAISFLEHPEELK
jgi:DNA-binding NarL/FixJ family response regulator